MRWKLAIVAVLVVTALLGAGLVLFVSAPSGQRVLTDSLGRALGGADQTVTVKEIGGDWPSHILWTGVALQDREGVWLTLDHVEINLRPLALLIGRVSIDSATIGTAHMLRRPVASPSTTPSPPPSVGGISAALGRITVRDARVETLRLDTPVIGRPVEAGVTASLVDDPRSRLHTLTVEGASRGEPGTIALKLATGRNAAVLQVNANAAAVTATGAITVNNRSNALSGALKMNCGAGTLCYAWPTGRIGSVVADLTLAGTLQSPEGRVSFQMCDVVEGSRRLAAFDGEIVARAKPEAPDGVIAITGSGTAGGVAAALPEGRPLVGDQGAWSMALTRTPDGALTLDTASLESGDAALRADALGLLPNLTPATLRMTLTGAARLLGRDDAASRTEIALRIDSLEDGGRGAGHLSLATTGLPSSAQIPPFLHAGVNLDADIAAAADGVKIANILGRSGDMTVRGSSAWRRAPAFDHLSSALTMTVPPAAGVLPEPTQIDVTLKGPLATLHGDISATAPAVILSRAPLRDAIVAVALDRTPEGFKARLDGNGQWIDGPLAFSAVASQAKENVIEIADIAWSSPSTDLSGALTFDTQSGMLSGKLGGPISDLAPLTTAFGAASAGAADLSATFVADETQRLEVTVAAREVQNAALTAGRLSFEGRFDDLWGELAITTRAEASEARLFDRPLAAFTTRAGGTLKSMKVELDAKGAADTPFSIASATDISFGDATVITFQRFAAQDGALAAALTAPAQLTLGVETVSLGPTRIATQGGTVEGSFTWNKTNDAFDGLLRAEKVALPAFTSVPGQALAMTVGGDLTFTGPMSAVNVAGRIGGALPGGKGQPPIEVTATIALQDGRAKIDASADGLSAEAARLVADIPARLNLAAGRFSLNTAEPVSASLKWTGNLAPLWRLVPSDVNVLAGDVAIDASLSGTLDAPVVSGAFNLSHGTYENLAGGTALRNIEAAIGGDGGGGFTLALKAQDMNDGNVTVSGRLAGDKSMTADVTADLARLDVLHRDDVVAAATGKVTYTGPLLAGRFQGQLQMVNSLVRLGGSYMPDIPLLRALPGFEPVSSNGGLSTVTLDIAVTTAGPMRIEGAGLDSLWRGDLMIAGTLARPDIRGAVTLDRGSFSFLGQSFTLDRGTVTFTGGGEGLDPQLNIVAIREASDITATVAITGRARAPDIQLSSRPALPRDEILARLLFRKGTGELGPIESIQLASAASDLAGISQGGINGLLRRTFGVDVSSGAEGNSVMVGRQVGRNLYVSVGQSLTEQEREIVVEWRLSRSFSLKSTTSDVTGADIGLFWRKDY